MSIVTSGPADGSARSTGPSVQSLVAQDTRPVPPAMRDTAHVHQGSADVPKTRYTSPVFAELEREFVWRRTWQMACHVDQIPKVGSHVVYDVADESILVVRTASGTIKAFHNACLHRGTKLRVDDGRVASFRCPFHGWTWDLDGQLTAMPGSWDFTQLTSDPTCTGLPEVPVALWQNWVFVNLDPQAEPFETYAAKLIEHFADGFDFSDRYIAFHAVKEVPANWKVVMEAFSEGYHVIATHPQILEFTGDDNCEYSTWPGDAHVSRFVNGFGIQSPNLGPLTEQQVVDAYLAFSTRSRRGAAVEVPEGATARPLMAEVFRTAMGAAYGKDLTAVSDTELLDAILYHLFPAFAPWAGVGQPLVYRWRPGSTPDTCVMDVYRMAPVPDGATERPAPAPTSRLVLEQSWKEAPGMGGLADVFEQDMENLPRVQAGLKSTGKKTVTFGNYQENRLRLIHRTIDAYITRGLAEAGRAADELGPFAVPQG
jgi:phenylpropionate dioxygenase-like ring-hydroxylating dioxygenase large terminal subunit